MKIQKELFESFLRKASINDEIKEGIINFNNEGITFINSTTDNNMLCVCTLEAKYILEHQAIGEIGVANIKLLRQIVNKMGSEISINVENNLLEIKDQKKKATFGIIEPSYIKQVPTEKILALQYPYTFEIDNAVMSDAISSCSVMADKIKVFTIEVFKSNINISSGNNNEASSLNRFFMEDNIKGNVEEKQRILIGEYIIKAMDVIDKPIQISVGDNKPFKIVEDNKIKTLIIIAPRVENYD